MLLSSPSSLHARASRMGSHYPLFTDKFLEIQQINAGSNTRAPLVFLHEGLGSVAAWRAWPQTLCAAAQRVGWVYSRQGYGQSLAVRGADVGAGTGKSTSIGAGMDKRQFAPYAPDYLHKEAWAVLPALLKRLGIASPVPPVLIGHSDGASIALLYASRYPVSACVVMAPHVMVEDLTLQGLAQIKTRFEQGDLRAHLQRTHADADGVFWRWNNMWRSPAFRDFDIRAQCQHIRAPVLAIQGEDDPYGSLAQITDIDLPAPQITRHIWPACGHHPQRDQAALTTQAMVAFLVDKA